MIKNFRPVGYINKNEKYKVKRKKKGGFALTSIILSGVMLFASNLMPKEPSKNTQDSTVSSSYSTSNTSVAFEEDNSIEEIQLFSSLNQTNKKIENDIPILLSCSNESNEQFATEISNYTPDYEFEDYYNIDQCVELYNTVNNGQTDYEQVLELKSFDADQLYDIVKKNNDKVFSVDPIDRGNFYVEMPDDEIKNICNLIIENIKEYENNPYFDKKEVLSTLSDLKIVYNKSSMSLAAVDSNNYMYVNNNMISVLSILNSDSDDNSLRSTIAHETAHLCQNRNINADGYESIGLSYTFDNVSVNGLESTWLLEAGAEKLSMNIDGRDNDSYTHQLGYLFALETVANLSSENEYNTIESLTLSNDLDNLYKAFNCETDEEKKEMLNLMYSITIQQDAPEDFYAKYNSDITEEETALLQRNLRNSIFTTLSQKFYTNLLEQVTNSNEVSLQDAFFLINIFESNIYSKTYYSKPQSYDRYKKFMTNYVNMQNDFFETIAKENNMEFENVVGLYNEYALNASENSNNTIKHDDSIYNCQLKWMNNKKISNYCETLQFLGDLNSAPIRSVVQERQINVKMSNIM